MDLKKLVEYQKMMPKDKYKMKSIKWYQKIKIFFSSWFEVIKLLPEILKQLKQLKQYG